MITTKVDLFTQDEIDEAAAIMVRMDLEQCDFEAAAAIREQFREVFNKPVFCVDSSVGVSMLTQDELKHFIEYLQNLLPPETEING